MVQITLITVGTLKERYLTEAVAEYKKRLSQFARVDEISIPEERIADEENETQIKGALEREADKILAALKRDAYKLALCVEGRQYSSPELAELLRGGADRFGKITLVIGSSHGLSERVKAACDERLSFSRLTFPHQLMRVILLEATYRAFTIIHGRKYHK